MAVGGGVGGGGGRGGHGGRGTPPQTFGEFSIQFTLLRSFRLFLSLTVRLP